MAYGNKNTLWVLDARRETPELMKEVKMKQIYQAVDMAATRFVHTAVALKIARLVGKQKRIELKQAELVEDTQTLDATARKTDEIRRALSVMTKELDRFVKMHNDILANIEDHEDTTEAFEKLCIEATELVRSELEL